MGWWWERAAKVAMKIGGNYTRSPRQYADRRNAGGCRRQIADRTRKRDRDTSENDGRMAIAARDGGGGGQGNGEEDGDADADVDVNGDGGRELIVRERVSRNDVINVISNN